MIRPVEVLEQEVVPQRAALQSLKHMEVQIEATVERINQIRTSQKIEHTTYQTTAYQTTEPLQSSRRQEETVLHLTAEAPRKSITKRAARSPGGLKAPTEAITGEEY